MNVIYYAVNAEAPALQWLCAQPEKVQDKFFVLFELLEKEGGSLKRPYAAPLRNKIYELRARWQRVNYRILYFFVGNSTVVLAHGCTKQDVVEAADIERAIARRSLFLKDPKSHTLYG